MNHAHYIHWKFMRHIANVLWHDRVENFTFTQTYVLLHVLML